MKTNGSQNFASRKWMFTPCLNKIKKNYSTTSPSNKILSLIIPITVNVLTSSYTT